MSQAKPTIRISESRQRHNIDLKLLTVSILVSLLLAQQLAQSAEALWFLQRATSITTPPPSSSDSGADSIQRSAHPAALTNQSMAKVIDTEQEPISQQQQSTDPSSQQSNGQLIDSPFSIAGIRPSSIASLLNTVSETGFHYFNVHDQCRSRTACDVGYMLYKKLNFVHNWIIRASVRTLVDGNNIYAISWSNGMMGKNCTVVYPACNQSPLESFMNFALLAS